MVDSAFKIRWKKKSIKEIVDNDILCQCSEASHFNTISAKLGSARQHRDGAPILPVTGKLAFGFRNQ